MKNKEQFDNSIKVLVKAYLEDTLIHTESCACAVGNLIADGMEYTIYKNRYWKDKNNNIIYPSWFQGIGRPNEETLELFNCTNYTVENIVLIERAFEEKFDDVDGYKGLCAVFDVLIKIHQGSDKELEEAKLQLSKQ